MVINNKNDRPIILVFLLLLDVAIQWQKRIRKILIRQRLYTFNGARMFRWQSGLDLGCAIGVGVINRHINHTQSTL